MAQKQESKSDYVEVHIVATGLIRCVTLPSVAIATSAPPKVLCYVADSDSPTEVARELAELLDGRCELAVMPSLAWYGGPLDRVAFVQAEWATGYDAAMWWLARIPTEGAERGGW